MPGRIGTAREYGLPAKLQAFGGNGLIAAYLAAEAYLLWKCSGIVLAVGRHVGVMTGDIEICTPEEVLKFWFTELSYDHWFTPDPGLDEQCAQRFQASHLALSRNLDNVWRETPQNWLAAVILFDQMPRNMYRGSPLAFATDCLALREAKLAIGASADMAVPREWRAFFYMPFEHSENLTDQTMSVKLFTELGDASYLDYAIRHRDVIERFGRFPHRNGILARMSSAAEEEYLAQPGAGF